MKVYTYAIKGTSPAGNAVIKATNDVRHRTRVLIKDKLIIGEPIWAAMPFPMSKDQVAIFMDVKDKLPTCMVQRRHTLSMLFQQHKPSVVKKDLKSKVVLSFDEALAKVPERNSKGQLISALVRKEFAEVLMDTVNA